MISNLLLVFGIAQLVGPDGARDRPALAARRSSGSAARRSLIALPAIVLGYTGRPSVTPRVVVSIPIAVVLLALYLVVDDPQSAPASRRPSAATPAAGAWTLSRSLVALGVATALTAVVSEILVHSLDAFAQAVGASEFFIAAVIVAIVGNAAEHGGAS